MLIKYSVVVEIFNKVSTTTKKFTKQFESILEDNEKLHGNEHILEERLYILNAFSNEIDAYCAALSITNKDIEINEFEIVSLTDKVDIFFEDPDYSDPNGTIIIAPTLKCFVYPEEDKLIVSELNGEPYDETTIIWSWKDDGHAHFLINDLPNGELTESNLDIIATIPIGRNQFVETGLKANTVYIRRIVSYDAKSISEPSAPCTVKTKIVPSVKTLNKYKPEPQYDFTTDESEIPVQTKRMHAFQSGIGYKNDLKIYKQMDSDFYEKFKAYFKITGKRTEQENRYEQVGFNYKICLEATENIQEQEGEVTFNIETFPRENISIVDYMWASKPITVKIKLEADVDLYQETGYTDVESTTGTTTKTTYPCFAGVHFVFCVDMSSSVGKNPNDRMTPLKNGIKQIAQELFNTKILNPATGQQEYPKYYASLVGFAKTAARGSVRIKNEAVGTANADQGAQAAINAFQNAVDSDLYFARSDSDSSRVKGASIGVLTNWTAGLKVSNDLLGEETDPNVRKVIILLSDGGHNCDFDNNYGPSRYSVPPRAIQSSYDSIVWASVNATGNANDVWAIVKCDNISNGIYRTLDEVWYPDQLTQNPTSNYIYDIAAMITKGAGSTNVDPKSPIIGPDVLFTLKNTYKSIIEAYQTPNISVGSESSEEEFDNSLNMGKYETAHLVAYLDYVVTEGDNTLSGPGTGYLKVEYDKKERRAVITGQIPDKTKVTSKSLFDIFYPLLKDSVPYKRGFRYTRNHYDGNTKLDGFIMKNLLISDAWIFADDDTGNTNVTQVDWSKPSYSKMGSIEVWTEMDTMSTSSKGDDRYFCTDSDYLYIKGYTDGILYDGTRYFTTELNAYDHPSEVMVSCKKTYEEYLTNRMNRSLAYSPKTGVINSALIFVAIDRDIIIKGLPGPIELQKEYIITGYDHDIIAENTMMYPSPKLNYRFNLEDPEAKTPYKEILPTCVPNSLYKHIVILRVYYAKNVYIWSKDRYIALFEGADGSYLEYIKRDEWIDQYLWFYAEKMWKDIPYYDEIPGKGMDVLYGLVNGRYRSDGHNGKNDLRVDTPEFNIPTSVTQKHADSIRIYIMITEMFPSDAIVSYKWDHPFSTQNDITKVNGDYVTFVSDSVTVKDVEYHDIIATYNMPEQEIFGQKGQEMIYSLVKPESTKRYEQYLLEVKTDNSDVIAMYYPSEIFFNEENEAEIGVTFKGVTNATSRWSPKIHNGYYYINQMEKYAYAGFNVEADFDTEEEISYDEINGYISIETELFKAAPEPKTYRIDKWTKSELLKNEDKFEWIDNKGLTVKPFLSGIFYERYTPQEYISPVLLFPNVLTIPKEINIIHTDSSIEALMVRSYDYTIGRWNGWIPFENNTAPMECQLSNAYQVKFLMTASTTETQYSDEDYLCCYLDWKDDMQEANTYNIVTITDHMTTGPYKASGTFVSRVLNFFCPTALIIDWFGSSDKISVQIAYSDDPEKMLLEHIEWHNWNSTDETSRYQYYRYKITIPQGEKLYWIHKKWISLKTEANKSFLTEIKMDGIFAPPAQTGRFINVESFKIDCDGKQHQLFNSLFDLISADVTQRGYLYNEIKKVSITSKNQGMELIEIPSIEKEFPEIDDLKIGINGIAETKLITQIYNTPFIFLKDGSIKIKGTPQNFAPITVEDKDGNCFWQVTGKDLEQTETFEISEETKFLKLKTNQWDNLSITADDTLVNVNDYVVKNHIIIFNNPIEAKQIKVNYYIKRSFIAEIDYENDTTEIKPYFGKEITQETKLKIFFETEKKSNRFNTTLSMNPIYRTDYKGFVYITEDTNEIETLTIHCNPQWLYCGGNDKIDIIVEALDSLGNPVIGRIIDLDCDYGTILNSTKETDENGVIHAIYKSSSLPSIDTVTARTVKQNMDTVRQTVSIRNKEWSMKND